MPGLMIWAVLIMGPYLLPAVLAAGLVAALAGGRSPDDGRGRAAGWLALVLGVFLLGGMTVLYD